MLLGVAYHFGMATPLLQISPIQFLWLAFGSPVLEELAFRGYLQGELEKVLQWKKFQISASNLLTSLAFCLLHYALYQMGWTLLVFFPSLVFGFFRDRYRSVQPAIAIHTAYNFAYFYLFGL